MMGGVNVDGHAQSENMVETDVPYFGEVDNGGGEPARYVGRVSVMFIDPLYTDNIGISVCIRRWRSALAWSSSILTHLAASVALDCNVLMPSWLMEEVPRAPMS